MRQKLWPSCCLPTTLEDQLVMLTQVNVHHTKSFNTKLSDQVANRAASVMTLLGFQSVKEPVSNSNFRLFTKKKKKKIGKKETSENE